jgi:hypothetical protein
LLLGKGKGSGLFRLEHRVTTSQKTYLNKLAFERGGTFATVMSPLKYNKIVVKILK